MTRPAATLNDLLLAAHAAGDARALPRLYRMAADRAEESGDIHRACFFLTQAWVFALEGNNIMAEELQARLIAHGRDTK